MILIILVFYVSLCTLDNEAANYDYRRYYYRRRLNDKALTLAITLTAVLLAVTLTFFGLLFSLIVIINLLFMSLYSCY